MGIAKAFYRRKNALQVKHVKKSEAGEIRSEEILGVSLNRIL